MLSVDGTHFTSAGHKIIASSIAKNLHTVSSSFSSQSSGSSVHLENKKLALKLADQLIVGWNDINSIFSDILTDSGDGYTLSWPDSNGAPVTLSNLLDNGVLSPEYWYMPYKADFIFHPTTVKNDNTARGLFNFEVNNGPPNTALESSIDGGAFSAVSRIQDSAAVVTDSRGFCRDTSIAGLYSLPNATYTFRYRLSVGDGKYMAFPPISLIVEA